MSQTGFQPGPTCVRCHQPVAVNEEGVAPVYCDRCAGQAVSRARRGMYTGSLTDFPATTTLIVINTLIFFAMVFTGGSITAAFSLSGFPFMERIQWGGNFGPFTLGGDYWRLVTACFVHAHLLHFGLNMWCLWSLGRLSERYFGRWFTFAIYLLTGAGGSLLSIAYEPARLSVGASGAIFGISGAIIAALKFGHLSIPAGERRAVLSSMISFAVINFALGAGYLGLDLNVDNMAHLGGFVTGLLVGLPLATSLTRSAAKNMAIHIGALAVMSVLLGAGYIERVHSSEYGNKKWMIEAEILIAAKDYPAAIRVLEKRTTTDPNDAVAQAWLGDAYVLNHEQAKAIAAYKKALELDPGFTDVQESLKELQGDTTPAQQPAAK